MPPFTNTDMVRLGLDHLIHEDENEAKLVSIGDSLRNAAIEIDRSRRQLAKLKDEEGDHTTTCAQLETRITELTKSSSDVIGFARDEVFQSFPLRNLGESGLFVVDSQNRLMNMETNDFVKTAFDLATQNTVRRNSRRYFATLLGLPTFTFGAIFLGMLLGDIITGSVAAGTLSSFAIGSSMATVAHAIPALGFLLLANPFVAILIFAAIGAAVVAAGHSLTSAIIALSTTNSVDPQQLAEAVLEYRKGNPPPSEPFSQPTRQGLANLTASAEVDQSQVPVKRTTDDHELHIHRRSTPGHAQTAQGKQSVDPVEAPLMTTRPYAFSGHAAASSEPVGSPSP